MEVDTVASVTADSEVSTKAIVENTEEKEATEKPVQNQSEEKNKDEFAYLENSGFTSEKFKIEIRGLPRYYGCNELKKLMNDKLKLASSKIKFIKPGSPFVFVCFRNEEDRKAAIKTIDGYNWKGKNLSAYEAKAAPDPLVKKRNAAAENEGIVAVKKRKTLEESVTTLAYLSYEEQLKQKQSEMENVLQKFGNEAWKSIFTMRKYIEEQRQKFNQMPCQLDPIKASPLIDGYRNKCEFTIGKDEQGEIHIGFRLGSYSNGFIEVGSIQNLKHIPDKMKVAVKYFEKFVRNAGYEIYNPETYCGNFRQLAVKLSQSNGEIMLVVGIHPQKLTPEQKAEIKSRIVKYFTEEEGKEIEITSLYYEEIEKRTSGQQSNTMEHLHGTTHIVDEIHGLKIRISPEAFFQVNTPSAEVMYQCAIDLASPTKNTTVLDICCGTGTIGLCFAKHCKQVLGVEIIPQAIQDAEHNAKANGIENCKFFAGNSDDLIASLVRNANIQKGEDVVAVVDPPRAGLHMRSIIQLRNSRGLNRLIYVSCAPRSAIKNWLDLIRPCSKVLQGRPFVAKRAVAVDLFPHTHHVELIILFERDVDPEVETKVEESDKKEEVCKPEDKEMEKGPTEPLKEVEESI